MFAEKKLKKIATLMFLEDLQMQNIIHPLFFVVISMANFSLIMCFRFLTDLTSPVNFWLNHFTASHEKLRI